MKTNANQDEKLAAVPLPPCGPRAGAAGEGARAPLVQRICRPASLGPAAAQAGAWKGGRRTTACPLQGRHPFMSRAQRNHTLSGRPLRLMPKVEHNRPANALCAGVEHGSPRALSTRVRIGPGSGSAAQVVLTVRRCAVRPPG